ncbi:MAG TPA: sensor domain-containing diguanylate cyclase [Gammaproteobacteria bacterium]|nr:sensor domain-containing diguanylate cyclase [Gammaproteobacteria bacterium]
MAKDLYAENKMLRRRLDDYIAQAHRNEAKLRRFQTHELRLISLNSLFELIQNVLYPDPAVFHWDLVTLLLLDPEYEIRRILEEEGVNLADHPALSFAAHPNDLDVMFPVSLFAYLGPYQPQHHAALFGATRRAPKSVALLPLVRRGKLIGSLNIGSYNAERFVKGVRTDFLEHLAAVVAICVENATNLERLKRQGLTDTLTAINNRRFFDQRLTEELDRAARDGLPLSCLLLDVDHFKKVNDNYGHQTGDQVLREVAALIRAQLRGSDVLSRYGGEEFAALLARLRAAEAAEVAERIRDNVACHRFATQDGLPFQVTLSIGVAAYCPRQPMDLDAQPRGEVLVGHADRALYEAKSAGRNRVIIAREAVSAAAEEWY